MITFYEICQRDVINMEEGVNMGRVDDLIVDEKNAQIECLVLYGHKKCFGLLGREDDLHIPWKDVVNLGMDVIMVNTPIPPQYRRMRHKIAEFFGF